MLRPFLDTLNQKKIILASGSAQRKDLLARTGITSFVCSPSGFAEDLEKGSNSVAYVRATSEQKLYAKVEELKQGLASGDEQSLRAEILITADTIISYNDSEVVEKCSSQEHAFEMLKRHVTEGNHQVYTSVWIAFLNAESQEVEKIENFVERTDVFWNREVSDEALQAYIATGEPEGKAGAYAIQGEAATFIDKIEGCYFNVVGFPLASFCKKMVSMLQ